MNGTLWFNWTSKCSEGWNWLTQRHEQRTIAKGLKRFIMVKTIGNTEENDKTLAS